MQIHDHSGTLILPAFAKINLGLRISGRRADGYHEIDTVLQTISLRDTLTFTRTGGGNVILVCDDRTLAKGADNLVHRAAVLLQQYAPNQGVQIRLTKRIPTHAGLGGGSSDAAVTLAGLSYLWRTQLDNDRLLDIAAALGADVPYFLFGGTARGTGTGTSLTVLDDSPQKFLLVLKPLAEISSAQAYAQLNFDSLTTAEAKTILSSSQLDEILDSFATGTLRNDFEAVSFQLAPEIARAKAALVKAGASSTLLAGSGAAVFGIFDNRQAQERAIQAIELEAGWRVFPCTTVGRSDYRRAMGPVGAIFARFSGEDAGA